MPPYAPSEDNEKAPIQDAESNTSADEIDPVAEQLLRRKLDWILLPLFTIVYCTNFVDRTAIGNARIAGLEKDLGMKGFDYNISLTIFYIFYIAAEIPSNLALKRFGSMWLAAMITSFGIVSIGTAFVKSYTGLIITRVFLGIAEGGTLPGLTYIMSRYYRRSELVLRVGIFFGISPPLAGALWCLPFKVGGLLASGLLSVGDFGAVTSWRKVFFIEGIITTGFGLLCFLIIPTDPQHTRIFTPAERALALARIDADQAVRTNGRKESTTLRLVWRSFNVNTMICTIAYVMINISFQGLSLFMPTVVATLGRFSMRTPFPNLAVYLLWAVVVTYVSFRVRKRGIPIICSCLLVVLGYALAVGTKNSHARYAACFLSIAGASPTGPLLITWGTDNAAPDTIRAVTTAIIPGIGALGSIIAVWTYLPQDAPNYHNGNSLNLATSIVVCLLALIGIFYIRWENSKRARGERDYRLEGKTQEQLENLGYLHPRFRYQI
ncbi:hypothetical protein EYR40_008568 [Pleurotus pulmonarius]|nr:hypothetical protein EYR36_009387 [Pleurotus pulmonarius]KAF4592884.1 hypothetical protein EYR38_008590 [Pleurotus pulmonarius]KAF4593774.1 hypothetical protein EYR40_008568 [Pleurotus pulmonarius]